MAEFFVESGPDVGESYVMTEDHATLGKGEAATFRLTLDPTLADLHAILRRRGEDLSLAPLHSTFPVLVNGRLIRRPTPLAQGDRITLGQDIIGCYFSTTTHPQKGRGWDSRRGRLASVLGGLMLVIVSVASAMMLFRTAPPTLPSPSNLVLGTPVWLPLVSEVAATSTQAPTPTLLPSPSATATDLPPTSTPTMPSVPTPAPVLPQPTPTFPPSLADHPANTPTGSGRVSIFGVTCQVPTGWVTYKIQWGDTLWAIAERFNTTALALIEGNCLKDETIYAEAILYVPPAE